MLEGKYTLETLAREKGITKQSAINLISKLKKQGLVKTTGGGKQKRIYTITKTPQKKTNGFFDTVNKYSSEKLVHKFKHYTYGNYTVEKAIIDGIKFKDTRTNNATMNLFRHIKNWKKLFELAKKNNLKKEVLKLYKEARKTTRCKKMPKRYEK